MNNTKKIVIGAVIGVVVACLVILISSLLVDDKDHNESKVNEPNKQSEVGSDKTEEKPDPVVKETIELAMVGDILLHTELAKYEDFSSSFEALTPQMQGYDYLIANQESLPIASKFGISGYPQFSSPEHILRDLKEAGVDMLNIGNNHAVDKFEEGLSFAIENIEKEGFPYVGAYKNEADRAEPRIVDVKGIKIGFVSYTYGTNGLYLPKDSDLVINYIDIEQMTKDIEEMKPLVDVTVAIIHWGAEYVIKENEDQNYIAKMMNQAGVDIIFGGHPHVLQPYEKIVNTTGQETHVFYSLGNFFARTISSEETMIGGIGSFEITKDGENITIDKPKLVASSLLKDSDGVYRIYPLAQVEERSIRNMEWVRKILGDEVIVE